MSAEPHLLFGDAMSVIQQFPDDWFDCVFVDPSYGQTTLSWDRRIAGWPAEVRRVLKPSGSMWVFGSLKSFMATAGEFSGWTFAQDIVWEKQNGSGFDNQRFRRVHEQAAMFYRSGAPWSGVYRQPQFTMDAKARRVRARADRVAHAGSIGPQVYETVEGGPRLARSVLRVRNCHRQGNGHATPKPEGIVEPLLRYSCPPAGRVLDPFAGSGTTGIVCRRLGLSSVLIENNAAIFELARQRLELRP